MIVAENIHFSYSSNKILNGIDLQLNPGELTTLLGRNGEGKSTLFRILTGEIQPELGSVFINEQNISGLDWKYLATKRSVLPQESRIHFPLKVEEIVAMGRSPHKKSPSFDMVSINRSIELCEIGHLRNRFYEQLSGGEKKRVQIARVLCQLEKEDQSSSDGILFLDEPVNSLDILLQHRIMELLRHLADHGYAVFLILHDWNLAGIYSDRILILRDGKIQKDGAPSEVLHDHELEKSFQVKVRTFPGDSGRVSGYSLSSLNSRLHKNT